MSTETKLSPATEASPEQASQSLVEDAFQKIRRLQSECNGAVLKRISCLSYIGAEFNDLKTQVPHGDWQARVKEEFGYDPATVSRLRKLASADLAAQIVTIGQGLQGHLTADIQKLAMFVDVPPERWAEALERFNFAELSRRDVRLVVDDMLAEGDAQSNEGKPGAKKRSRTRRKPTTGVKGLTKVCGTVSGLTESVLGELQGGSIDDPLRLQAKAAIETAISTLQALLAACEESAA